MLVTLGPSCSEAYLYLRLVKGLCLLYLRFVNQTGMGNKTSKKNFPYKSHWLFWIKGKSKSWEWPTGPNMIWLLSSLPTYCLDSITYYLLPFYLPYSSHTCCSTARHVPTSEPLHLLFPLSGIVSPESYSQVSCLTSLQIFVKIPFAHWGLS